MTIRPATSINPPKNLVKALKSGACKQIKNLDPNHLLIQSGLNPLVIHEYSQGHGILATVAKVTVDGLEALKTLYGVSLKKKDSTSIVTKDYLELSIRHQPLNIFAWVADAIRIGKKTEVQ